MKINFVAFFIIFSLLLSGKNYSQERKFEVNTIAFYNFENLFDTINNANNDEEWLPSGAQNWTSKKYREKLNNLSKVLSEIGTKENPNAPTIIGGCEIENRGVLEDLIKSPKLINYDYGIVHFDSPDRRGIDVALLYQKKHFKPTSTSNIPLLIYRNDEKEKESSETEDEKLDSDKTAYNKGERVYTRDILLVTGFLNGEEINVIVNHWPSRSGGEKRTAAYREAAGKLNRKIMDSIYKINPNAKIMTMGDFNDGTYNKSIKEGIGAKLKKEQVEPFGVYNPFEQMAKNGDATLFYRDAGDIFDQIMVSETLLKKDYTTFQYWKAGIFNQPYLIQKTGKYAGYPLRHSSENVGYSDHFPVYIYLIKEKK
ncbi:MAG TPA: hypothetical protein VN192_04875 [Flavobacterium sp.]|nr:hypothetical protein [Flavobacterium sp.]